MAIDNLKKVVNFGLSLGETIIAASAQSTTLGRASTMLPLVEDLPALFGVDYSQLGAEVKGLTPEELTDLNSYIDANFSIADADKEQKIEAAISVVIDLVKVVEKAVAIWQTQKSAAEASPPAAS